MYLRRSEDTVDNHVDVLVLRDVQGLNNWFRLFVWLVLIMENQDIQVSLQKSSKIPLDWWRREGWSSQEEEKESTSLEPPSAPAFNCSQVLIDPLFPHNVWTLSSDLTWCFGIFHTGKGIFHISQRQIFLQRHLLISDFKLDQCRNAVVSSESKWIVLWNIQNQFYYFTNQNLIKAWYIQRHLSDKKNVSPVSVAWTERPGLLAL